MSIEEEGERQGPIGVADEVDTQHAVSSIAIGKWHISLPP